MQKTATKWATEKTTISSEGLNLNIIIKSRILKGFITDWALLLLKSALREKNVGGQFSNSEVPGTLFSDWPDATACGSVKLALNSLWQNSLYQENSIVFPGPWRGGILLSYLSMLRDVCYGGVCYGCCTWEIPQRLPLEVIPRLWLNSLWGRCCRSDR